MPTYRSADLFWEKYPNLFEGKYPLKMERLNKEVNKYSKGCVIKSNEILGWKAKTSLKEGFKNTVEYAIKMGI